MKKSGFFSRPYIANNNKVYVVESNGKSNYEIESEDKIHDMFFTSDGRILLSHTKGLEELVCNKKVLKPVKSAIVFPIGVYEKGREKEILYSSENNLYTCNPEDKEPVKLLNWTSHDINSKNLLSFAVLKDGRISAFTAQDLATRGECELVILEKQKDAVIPAKKTITYGCGYGNMTIQEQVIRFNKINKKYEIEILLYEDEGADLETRKLILQKEIASGNEPDIMDIGIFFTEKERMELIDIGILENLNPYLAADKKIRREDYLEQILNVYEKNEYLYAIMPSFGMDLLAGTTGDIGNAPSWSMEGMIEFIKSQSDGKRILPGVDQQELLTDLLKLNSNEFVDLDTKTCNFDSENFKKILKFVSLLERDTEENFYWFHEVEQLRNKEISMMKWSAISIQDMQTIKFLYGDAVNAIGYPSISGKGVIAFPCVSVLGICSTSDNKQGAWEFIRFLLEEEQQFELGVSGDKGFPIKKSALNRVYEKAKKKEYKKDEKGNKIEKEKSFLNIGSRDDADGTELTIPFYSSTEDEIALVNSLVDLIGNNMETRLEPEVMDIILEEAGFYFNKQKTVEEVTQIIQNRVQIFLDEQQ